MEDDVYEGIGLRKTDEPYTPVKLEALRELIKQPGYMEDQMVSPPPSGLLDFLGFAGKNVNNAIKKVIGYRPLSGMAHAAGRSMGLMADYNEGLSKPGGLSAEEEAEILMRRAPDFKGWTDETREEYYSRFLPYRENTE